MNPAVRDVRDYYQFWLQVYTGLDPVHSSIVLFFIKEGAVVVKMHRAIRVKYNKKIAYKTNNTNWTFNIRMPADTIYATDERSAREADSSTKAGQINSSFLFPTYCDCHEIS